MNIYPIFDNILLEPAEVKENKSAVLLPNTVQDKPYYGKVIACPEGDDENNIIVSPGDTVIFNKFAGTEFKYSGKTYILIKQKEIMAIIKE